MKRDPEGMSRSLITEMVGIKGRGMNHMIEVQSGAMNQRIERTEIGEMKRGQEGTSLSRITKMIDQRMMNTIDTDLTDEMNALVSWYTPFPCVCKMNS